MADSGEDAELKKCINDFNSLYLNRKVDYSPQSVACGAALIKMMYELIMWAEGWKQIYKAFEIERKLLFEKYTGKEKGQRIKQAREVFIIEFLPKMNLQIKRKLNATKLNSNERSDIRRLIRIYEYLKWGKVKELPD